MKTIDEIQYELKCVYSDLEKIKEAQKADEVQSVNFREIASKAERYLIKNHPMLTEDEHTQSMYLLVLLSCAALDAEAYSDSFCIIYRIAYGMCYTGNVEELFLSAKQIKFETIDECTRLFLNDDRKLLLLLECMLVSGTFQKERRKAMEYIAQLAVLLNITKEQIIFLSNTARVILTQNLDEYHCEIPNTYGELFDCYLDAFDDLFEIEIIEKTISLRERQGEMPVASIRFTYDKYNIFEEYKKYIRSLFGLVKGDTIENDTIHVDKIIVSCIQEWNNQYDYSIAPLNPPPFNGKEIIPLAVTANHYLAHSKALKKFKEAEAKKINNDSKEQ